MTEEVKRHQYAINVLTARIQSKKGAISRTEEELATLAQSTKDALTYIDDLKADIAGLESSIATLEAGAEQPVDRVLE